jgi:hypothetical protein
MRVGYGAYFVKRSRLRVDNTGKRRDETQLCDMGMAEIWWGVLCATYGGKNSIVGIVLWCIVLCSFYPELLHSYSPDLPP